MCIIVSKEKGVELPSKDILEQCFFANPDGAGLMYVKKGKVNIVKGFMTFDSFYEYLMKLDKLYDLKQKALVMHFRISTQGNVDAGNCHPFPITSSKKMLRSTICKTDVGMAHNGIISTYSYKKGELNDTQLFIQHCVSAVHDLDKEFYKNDKVMHMLEDIAGSKLCFLDSEENIHYVGNFVEENGVKYSNTTYKAYYSYPKYYNYDCYSDYDYYDFGELEDKTNKRKKQTFDEFDQLPLTKDEFDYFLDFLTVLDKGTTIKDSFGEMFTIDEDNRYALDSYFNLHYIDWKVHDIYQVYEDCTIVNTKKLVDEDENEDESNDI